MQGQALKALQQRVVQFPGDSCAFIYARFQPNRELPLHLPNPKLIDGQQQKHKCGRADRSEPNRLVVCGKDGKIQRGSGLVPDAVVIACDHAEAIVARTEVVITSLASCPSFLPASIVTFKFVSEKNPARNR